MDEVAGFAFPRHELTPKSAARLVVLAKCVILTAPPAADCAGRYGPLVDGQLMAGAGRSVPVPEHFAYRVPVSLCSDSRALDLTEDVCCRKVQRLRYRARGW